MGNNEERVLCHCLDQSGLRALISFHATNKSSRYAGGLLLVFLTKYTRTSAHTRVHGLQYSKQVFVSLNLTLWIRGLNPFIFSTPLN